MDPKFRYELTSLIQSHGGKGDRLGVRRD
ncbi:Protein of unknown function [Lactobacillus delbrueckii subsp. lactis]|nr:Protein of unknown function [Lactobacillus delbrueckii subsp. lactis]